MSSSKPTAGSAPATEKVKPIRRKTVAAPLAPVATLKTPTPKVETLKAEAPKVETPKVEAPKVETPKAAAPKAPEIVKELPAKVPPAKAPVAKPAVAKAPTIVAPVPAPAAPVAVKPVPVPATPVIPTPAKPVELAVKAVAATVETVKTVAAASEKRLKNLASDLALEPGKVKKMSEFPSVKGYEDLTKISKANLDALVQANKVFAQGVEAISKEALSLTQSSFESAATAAKALFAAKTLQDVVALNADFTRSYFDRLLANSTKLGEMSVKLATDTFAPITARVNNAVETAIKHNPVEKLIKPAA